MVNEEANDWGVQNQTSAKTSKVTVADANQRLLNKGTVLNSIVNTHNINSLEIEQIKYRQTICTLNADSTLYSGTFDNS